MTLNRTIAEEALIDAHAANPGPWAEHSRYVALACEKIASRCPGLDPKNAYLYGLLHLRLPAGCGRK